MVLVFLRIFLLIVETQIPILIDVDLRNKAVHAPLASIISATERGNVFIREDIETTVSALITNRNVNKEIVLVMEKTNEVSEEVSLDLILLVINLL